MFAASFLSVAISMGPNGSITVLPMKPENRLRTLSQRAVVRERGRVELSLSSLLVTDISEWNTLSCTERPHNECIA